MFSLYILKFTLDCIFFPSVIKHYLENTREVNFILLTYTFALIIFLPSQYFKVPSFIMSFLFKELP